MKHPQLNPEEELVLRVFLEQAVQIGDICVEDEEETVVRRSRSVETILENLGHTEQERIYVFKPGIESIGWIEIVYGDAATMISDHTDNEIIGGMVKDAMQALERSRVFSLQG